MESQWLELLFQCIFRLSFHLHDLAIPTIIGHIIGRIAAEVSQIMAYNASAMLGLHALIDLNVNYYGWTQDQVADYLKQFFSIDQEQVAENTRSDTDGQESLHAPVW